MLTIFEVYGLNFLNFWKYLYSPHGHRLLPYGHCTVIVRRPYNWYHTVRKPCGALTGAARST